MKCVYRIFCDAPKDDVCNTPEYCKIRKQFLVEEELREQTKREEQRLYGVGACDYHTITRFVNG